MQAVVVVPVLSTGTEESPRVSLTAAELFSTGSEHFLLRSEEQIIIKELRKANFHNKSAWILISALLVTFRVYQ